MPLDAFIGISNTEDNKRKFVAEAEERGLTACQLFDLLVAPHIEGYTIPPRKAGAPKGSKNAARRNRKAKTK